MTSTFFCYGLTSMLVFRFETPEGVGMYYHDDSTSIINNGTSDPNRWPMPHDDKRFSANKKVHRATMYPDNSMLDSTKTQCMFMGWCNDLRNCGLFEFYDEQLYRFGFSHYSMLDRWVSEVEWRKQLVEAKVFLNVYDVDEDYVILGYTQCTFRLDKAKLLHSFIATATEEHIIKTLMAYMSPSKSAELYYKDFINEACLATMGITSTDCSHPSWTEESAANNWRSNCTKCGLKASGSCQ